MAAGTVETLDLRTEFVSSIVDGFALQEFKIKPLFRLVKSMADKESYFEETATELTGGTGSNIEDVAALASFPYGEVVETKRTATQIKHAFSGQVSIEAERLNDVDALRRTTFRIGRGVANSVDIALWNVLTDNQNTTSTTINNVTVTNEWEDFASATIVVDITKAIRLIAEQNYQAYGNVVLLINAETFAALLSWNIETKGSSVPQFSSDKVVSGAIGEYLSATVIVSEVVTNDFAAIAIPKTCGTYYEVQSLTTELIKDPGVKTVIRSWEIGIGALTNPGAVTLLDNVGPS